MVYPYIWVSDRSPLQFSEIDFPPIPYAAKRSYTPRTTNKYQYRHLQPDQFWFSVTHLPGMGLAGPRATQYPP
ncbi:MAG: hypothetical protein Fur0025_16310 [Oscillatoriaceae cyanobacterium]